MTQNQNEPTMLSQWRDVSKVHVVLRVIAGIAGGIGLLAAAVLAGLWIAGIVLSLRSGTIMGYFGGATQTDRLLFISCVFYALFLPLQALSAELLYLSRRKMRLVNPWARISTMVLWALAVGFMWYLAKGNSAIADGAMQLLRDVR